MLHETYLSDSYYLSSTDILVYNSIFFFLMDLLHMLLVFNRTMSYQISFSNLILKSLRGTNYLDIEQQNNHVKHFIQQCFINCSAVK